MRNNQKAIRHIFLATKVCILDYRKTEAFLHLLTLLNVVPFPFDTINHHSILIRELCKKQINETAELRYEIEPKIK